MFTCAPALFAAGSSGPATDPFFANVRSLIHFDGSDASTVITDQIANTWTAIGNAQLDTANKLFGASSLLLDGSGDYVTGTPSGGFLIGTGDFTGEIAIYPNSLTTDHEVFSVSNGINNVDLLWEIDGTNGSVRFSLRNLTLGTTNFDFNSPPGAVSTGSWQQIAISVHGSTAYIYVNGIMVASSAVASVRTNVFNVCQLGTLITGAPRYFNGWLDEFRWTTGVDRYAGANYTPAVAPFPNS